MRLSTALVLALGVLLGISLVGAVAAASPSPSPHADVGSHSQLSTQPGADDADSQPLATQGSTASTDSTTQDLNPEQIIRLAITDDGDAEWTIESRFLLTDEDDVEAFEEYAQAVSNGEREPEYSPEQFERVKDEVQDATDREMAIEDASWNEPRIEAPNADEREELGEDAQIGVISFSFTWTNFGTVDGDRVYVDDVFQNEHRSPIPSLTDGQRLVIEAPPGYEGATPGGDEGTYVWDGPLEFEDEPDLVFLGNSGWLASLGWGTAGIAALALVFGTGGYLLARRREQYEWLPDGPTVSLPSRGGNSAESTANSSAQPAPDGEPAANGGETAKLEFDESTDVDPELLSDEERVKRLLHENGGRMKQASIVKETGWSNAKVSQLLSKMDDDDEIEKLRIGRENLITLPEVDPTEIE